MLVGYLAYLIGLTNTLLKCNSFTYREHTAYVTCLEQHLAKMDAITVINYYDDDDHFTWEGGFEGNQMR